MSATQKREVFARAGIASKGIIYLLIGALATATAIGWGGEKGGSTNVLEVIEEQSFGQALVFILAIGLSGYVFYRVYAAIKAFNSNEDKKKRYTKAFFLFVSGLWYAVLAFSAVKLALGITSDSETSSFDFLTKGEHASKWLTLLALIFLGKAVFEFYRAISGRYKRKFDHVQIKGISKENLSKLGLIGHLARGVVVGIMAYLTGRAAFFGYRNGSGNTEKAFDFVQYEFGNIFLIAIAGGLGIFGIYMLLLAYSGKAADMK